MPNSAKTVSNRYTDPSPLQYSDELHQKDLRIMSYFMHIWDPENEAYLRADTFLALSLIVDISVPRDPFTRRRVDIPVKRPCKLYKIY